MKIASLFIIVFIFGLAISPVHARDVSCGEELGAKNAAILVQQCISISPATHPPCNDTNSCRMITNEIVRGCAFGQELLRESSGEMSEDADDFCTQYLREADYAGVVETVLAQPSLKRAKCPTNDQVQFANFYGFQGYANISISCVDDPGETTEDVYLNKKNGKWDVIARGAELDPETLGIPADILHGLGR